MKRSFSIILVLFVAVIFLSGCKETGTLSGTVSFSGVPCKPGTPDYRVPPCTGPYPEYSVEVFKKGSKEKPVGTSKTDENGAFKLDLPAGEYVIYTQNGISKENLKSNEFTIKAGEEAKIELQISTGVQ